MTGYFRNADTEEKSTEEEGNEVRPEEVKFNQRDRSHQNRSYRRTCPLDSDDDSDVSSWSPSRNPGEVGNNEAESIVETNNNDEHEIMSGVIEFVVSFWVIDIFKDFL